MDLTTEKISIIILSLELRINEIEERIKSFKEAIEEGEQVERFTKALKRSEVDLLRTKSLLKEMSDYIGT